MYLQLALPRTWPNTELYIYIYIFNSALLGHALFLQLYSVLEGITYAIATRDLPDIYAHALGTVALLGHIHVYICSAIQYIHMYQHLYSMLWTRG